MKVNFSVYKFVFLPLDLFNFIARYQADLRRVINFTIGIGAGIAEAIVKKNSHKKSDSTR